MLVQTKTPTFRDSLYSSWTNVMSDNKLDCIKDVDLMLQSLHWAEISQRERAMGSHVVTHPTVYLDWI